MKIKKCVDFTSIDAPLPFNLSQVTGLYLQVDFVFSDHTLKSFIADLVKWVKDAGDDELERMKQNKIRFLVDFETLSAVTHRTMKDVIECFYNRETQVFHHFALEMKLPLQQELEDLELDEEKFDNLLERTEFVDCF